MERNVVTIRFLITTADLLLKQITIQEYHNTHTYSLFCLAVLAMENLRYRNLVQKPGLFILSFLTKEQSFKNQKFHTFL